MMFNANTESRIIRAIIEKVTWEDERDRLFPIMGEHNWHIMTNIVWGVNNDVSLDPKFMNLVIQVQDKLKGVNI